MADWTPFLDEKANDFRIDLDDGSSVNAWGEEMTTCYAEWGGWRWEASGGDRFTASRRLADRLESRNPFMGVDWGDPGTLSGRAQDLDSTIPEHIRRLMVEYHAARERCDDELLRYVH